MRSALLSFVFLTLACHSEPQAPTGALKGPSVVVVNGGDNSLSVIDPYTFKERERLFIPAPMNTYAHHIGVSPDRQTFAIAFPTYDFSMGHDGLHNLETKGYVVVYDRGAERRKLTIPVAFANHNAIFSPDGTEIWTALVSHSGRVLVHDSKTGNLVKEIAVGADPHDVLFAGNYVVVTCMESSFLTVIDPESKRVVRDIKVDPFPSNVWPGRHSSEVIVENSNQKSLNFVDLAAWSVTDHIDVPFKPGYSSFAPNNELWICAKGENAVYIYQKLEEKWQLQNRIETQNDPHQLLFLEGNAWLINQKQHTIEVFDLETKAKQTEIPTGLKPNAIVYIP